MTRIGTKLAATAVVLAALVLPADGQAQTLQPAVSLGTANMVVSQNAAATADQGGLSDATKQGIGCIATGTGSLAYATFAGGATESLMLVAGGLLAPSVTPTLWLGLTATLVASTCAMGAAATPAVLWAVEQKDNIGANLIYQAKVIGFDVLEASSALVSGLFAGRPASSDTRLMAERQDVVR
ncbi:MAG: hypothetical protein WCF85_04835 [Rhodospirillaceae bacterium]